MYKNIPIKHPHPDAKRFIDILLGRIKSNRIPLVEYLVDDVLMKPIVTEMLGRIWVDDIGTRDSQKAYLDNFIQFWYRFGYDFVRFERGLPFLLHQLLAEDATMGVNKPRAWADEHQGTITSWEDFEKYPWPKVDSYDFFPFEYINNHLPEGMGLMTCHAGGIYEHLSMLMSYEGLCLALYDNPELVQAVSDKLGGLMEKFYLHLIDLDKVFAIFPGDDMGFRSGTLISPADLRKYCFPWHKKFADMAHRKGLPYFLHSCGNLETIMEDLISEVKIDGKHSFEDAIIPVQEFQKKYGDRIAVLGGLDVDILTSASSEEVRKKTRKLIDTCGNRGRYALGSGNSIPSYIPLENYLAMLDEALT
ncbi:MAG: uroporphyrinogen decarboxylase family protein [bacterium]|nr:uroporphyrinogen decarboxylase family protein [bacterium]